MQDFFKSEINSNIVDISAIAGENTSGKSTLIIAIRMILDSIKTESKLDFNYALVCQIEGTYELQSNIDNITLEVADEIINAKKCKQPFCTPIFYSPSYDFRGNSIDWFKLTDIDISNDHFLKSDISNVGSNLYDAHKMSEVLRQISFASAIGKTIIRDKIKIPTKLNVYISNFRQQKINKYTAEHKSNIKH